LEYCPNFIIPRLDRIKFTKILSEFDNIEIGQGKILKFSNYSYPIKINPKMDRKINKFTLSR